MANKWIKVHSHGSAYTFRYGELIVAPLKRDHKGIYKDELASVYEAPKSYKAVHKRVMKQLGVPEKDALKYLNKIIYY